MVFKSALVRKMTIFFGLLTASMGVNGKCCTESRSEPQISMVAELLVIIQEIHTVNSDST